MKMWFPAPDGIPGTCNPLMDERYRISDRCPPEWRWYLFLPLPGVGYAGIQREHKPDYRHRDRGAEKIISDFLHVGAHAAEFQDSRCRLTAYRKKMFPGLLLSTDRTITIPYPAAIDRCIRETGIPCQSFCDGCLAGSQRPDEQDFLGFYF